MKRPGGTIGFGDYCRLVPSEPFRLFFPVGLLVSIGAALLWPLCYASVLHAKFALFKCGPNEACPLYFGPFRGSAFMIETQRIKRAAH